jgi:hypothetical protein
MRKKLFTPGPWTYRHGRFNRGYRDDLDQVGSIHGSQWYIAAIEEIYHEETEANAHLIAAAPDLLDALEIAISVMKGQDIDEALAGEFEVFEDAVAKAYGGPS